VWSTGAYPCSMRSVLLCRSLGVPDAVSERGVAEAMIIRLARLAGDHGEIGPERHQDAASAIAAVEKGLSHGALDLLLIGEDDADRVVAALLVRVQGYVDRDRLQRYTRVAIEAISRRVAQEAGGTLSPA
jgi:hypothetical protein